MERVEGAPGEALAARARFVAAQAARPGPGQPDLCWLERRSAAGAPPAPPVPADGEGRAGVGDQTGGLGAPGEPEPSTVSAYHWALGQEVSSAAALAAYVARCTGEAEAAAAAPGAVLGGLLARTLPSAAARRAAERSVAAGSRRVSRGVYCCYDLFSRSDVRVEVALPGGVRAFSLDARGVARGLSAGDLQGAVASAFLRWAAWDGAAAAELGCVRAGGWFREAEGEAAALEALAALYRAGLVQPLRAAAHLDPGLGSSAEDFDPFAASALFLFLSTGRALQAGAWFRELAAAAADPVLRLYEAAAMKAAGDLDAALATLLAALRAALVPPAAAGGASAGGDQARRMAEEARAALLCAVGALQLDGGDAARAGESAREALALDPDYRPAGLLLARALAAAGSPALALATLNACPPPPEADAPIELLLAAPPPPSSTARAPGARGEPSPAWAAGPLTAAEEAALDLPGRPALAALAAGALFPGAVAAGPLGDRRLAPTGAQPLRLPAHVRAAAFDILVELAGDAGGWEAFLAARAEVFLLAGSAGEEVTADTGKRGSGRAPAPKPNSQQEEGPRGGGEAAGRSPAQRSGGTEGPEVAAEGAEAPPGQGTAPRATPAPAGEEGSSGSPEGGGMWGGAGNEEALEPVPQLEGEASFGPVGESGGSSISDSGEEESSGASVEGGEDTDGKVLCEVWLDELIQALYEDLTEYVELQSYRQKVHSFGALGAEAALALAAAGGGGSGSGSGSEEEEGGFGGGGSGPASEGDWLRWGALCERLGQLDSAVRCFEAAAAAAPPAGAGRPTGLLASAALLRLKSLWGLPRETAAAAAAVLEGLYAVGALPADAEQPPMEVSAALCSAIARAGLQATRRAAARELAARRPRAAALGGALGGTLAALGLAAPARLPPRALERLLSHAFLESVRWQSAGFER